LDEKYLTLEFLVKEMLNMKEKRDLETYLKEERPKPPPVSAAWYPPREHQAAPDHRRQASYGEKQKGSGEKGNVLYDHDRGRSRSNTEHYASPQMKAKGKSINVQDVEGGGPSGSTVME
jgi:hypothetical protein